LLRYFHLLNNAKNIIKENEYLFLFQEFIYGHSNRYIIENKLSRTEYYNLYLNEIYSFLESEKMLDETLIVITADHGSRARNSMLSPDGYKVPFLVIGNDLNFQEDTSLLSHLDFNDIIFKYLLDIDNVFDNNSVMFAGATNSSLIGFVNNKQEYGIIDISKNKLINYSLNNDSIKNISEQHLSLYKNLLFIFYYISINAGFVTFLMMSFVFLFLIILIISIYLFYPNIGKPKPFPKKTPSLAVVTYAFNNFLPVKRTVKALLKLKYPIPFTVYVITDGTCTFLKEIKGVKQIVIDKKYFQKAKNTKSIIMNKGLKYIKEENMFCVDGDTMPEEDVLMKMTGFLDEENTVAVNGVLVPENREKFWEKVQVIEYSLNWGIYLRILSAMNSVNIPIGAMFLMKKKVFDQLGGYSADNFVEDKELGYRIIKAGYRIRCCDSAYGFTETPSNIKGWFKQRKRWSRGELATIFEHRDVLFNLKYNLFGLFVLPFTFFLQTIGVAFVFSYIFIFLKRQIIYLYFLGSEFLLNSMLVLPKFGSFILPSTIYVVFLSIVIFLIYAIFAFRITRFNLNYKYIIPFIFFILIYMYLLVSVYLISIIQEFLGFENKW